MFFDLSSTISIAIFVGVFCAYLAEKKNRNPIPWFLLGLFFNVFALLIIFAMDPLKPKPVEVPIITPAPPVPHKKKLTRLLYIVGAIALLFVIAFILKN